MQPQPDRLYQVRAVTAASIKAGEPPEKGFSQVLWLDGVEKKYVEEVGSMNIMFRSTARSTPLPAPARFCPALPAAPSLSCSRIGVTRLIEGKLAIADVMKAARKASWKKCSAPALPAVVSPVKELDWKDGKVANISGGKIGP